MILPVELGVAREAATRPVIGITLGDPGGVGPEVTLKALADARLRTQATFRLYGPRAALGSSKDPESFTMLDDPDHDGRFPATDTAQGGRLSFRAVEAAIADARRSPGDPRRVDAIVTAPISKKAWALAGHPEFPGHTELLAARCGVDRYAMMFLTPRLRVVLATTHLPLSRVPKAVTTARVVETIELGADACRRLGIAAPRIAVCGLNPHAGEDGLLGAEDRDVIAPAIRQAAGAGLDCKGPFPGDTIFNAALRGDYDLVVAMYHDQGLIPVKLLDRDAAVNITLGLPIIRTSPDHGTAFDIAGRDLAEAGSMKTAIETAIRMVASSMPRHPL